MAVEIDLNADVGEECGDDEALFGIVTSANVAAGGHAGGGSVLHQTVRLASSAGVRIGAHPSYPDRAGFGRHSRASDHDASSVEAFVSTQVLEVAGACLQRSVSLAHVKAHGALYNDAVADTRLAEAFLSGVRRASAELGGGSIPVMGIPDSALHRACERSGVPFLAEAFADRAYAPDGSLVSRQHPGAVLHDHAAAARQAVRVALEGSVVATDGTVIAMPAVTVCLHGDTPGAVAMALAVRRELEAHGIRVVAPGGTP
jgi:UPF0271 protein